MDSDRKSKYQILKRDKSVKHKNNNFQKINVNNINNALIIQKRHQTEKNSQKNIQEINVKTKNKNNLIYNILERE